MKSLSEVAVSVARRLGIQISRVSSEWNRLPVEVSAQDRELVESLRPFTMTSAERLWSLIEAVRYIDSHGIPGDFVECGVWRGGSVMAMANTLLLRGKQDRDIWLYDTFQGMTDPTAKDVEAGTFKTATSMLDSTPIGDGNNVWCVADRRDVEMNLASTRYPFNKFHFIEGDVSQSLPESGPDAISILRLDTDWYESTKVCIEALYPRLVVGGVCILDDYGHWLGARRAVDEYFEREAIRPYMHPIDYSGRVFIKIQ